MNVQHGSGLVSVSVLAMILAGLISGLLIGTVFGGLSAGHLVLAIVCGIVAAILALVIRNALLHRNAAFPLPWEITFSWVAIAAIIGGLAGHELAIDLAESPRLPIVGALSGLLASVLIATLAATIYILRTRLLVSPGSSTDTVQPAHH